MLLAAIDLAATVENEPVLPYPAVGRHLTDLADAALTAALAVAVARVCPDQPVPVRLAVVAMGKSGARELNYVSDVDVVFVAEPADTPDPAGRGDDDGGLQRLLRGRCGAAARGKAGALVRTLESHVTYYKRWARTWEFQALLKNRPATGDLELGEQYRAALMPMVWNASERPDFVADVQAMRRRVEDLVPADLRERELKLGHGSLRDVEFAVQLLQLVHGKADESLHVQGTVEALTALGKAAMSAATTPPISPPRTNSCGCSSIACSCSGSSAPTRCPPSTTRRACAGWPARRICARTAARTRSGSWPVRSSATRCGCAACTPSCSIVRCWIRCRGPGRGLAPRPRRVSSPPWAMRPRRTRWVISRR